MYLLIMNGQDFKPNIDKRILWEILILIQVRQMLLWW